MKKTIFMAVSAFSALMFLASCGSVPNAPKSSAESNSNTKVAANKTYIRDWMGRSVGAEAQPEWLKTAIRGNFDAAKAHFGIDGDVIKSSEGWGADPRAAQMRASMNYSRKVARELQQSISTYAAEKARSGSMTAETKQAIEEVTQTQSNVEITGHENKAEFWQIIDEDDALTGKTQRKCVLYQIYVIPANTWMRTGAKYVKSVLGELPEDLTPEEAEVKDLIKTMMEDARHPTVMTQKEKEQEIEYSRKLMDAQAKLAPEKQKAAAQQELVKIAQEGKTERTKIKADAQTKQVQARADAQTSEYLSGNKSLQVAATITPDDANWLEAMEAALAVMY